VAYVIAQAQANDTIHLMDGTFFENLVIHKSLSIIDTSMDKSFLDGDGANNHKRVITIEGNEPGEEDSPKISISDLTIQNGVDSDESTAGWGWNKHKKCKPSLESNSYY